MIATTLPTLSLSADPDRPGDARNLRRVTPDSEIDDALVRRFTAGDEAAFAEIVARFRTKIFNVAYGVLRNHADADEITQDTFIRAHRALDKFRGDSSLSSWLHRIALNLARNRYWYFFRRHRQDSISLDGPLSADNTSTIADLIADQGHDPAREAITVEFSTLVDRCMKNLDPRKREILTQRNVLNRSYVEIGLTLGINVGTVKSRIARARESLHQLLVEACPEFAPGAAAIEWFLPARGTGAGPEIACA